MAEDTQAADGVIQYLSFDLAGEVYGVEVSHVEVVLEAPRITRVPKSPMHLRGVINHRGSVVPVVDLASVFNFGKSKLHEDSAVVVTQIHYEDELITAGLLTDEVHEVIELKKNQIERTPAYGSRIENSFVSGIGKHNDLFIILLNLEKALSIAVNEGTNFN